MLKQIKQIFLGTTKIWGALPPNANRVATGLGAGAVLFVVVIVQFAVFD